jgi:hypothetical protein
MKNTLLKELLLKNPAPQNIRIKEGSTVEYCAKCNIKTNSCKCKRYF